MAERGSPRAAPNPLPSIPYLLPSPLFFPSPLSLLLYPPPSPHYRLWGAPAVCEKFGPPPPPMAPPEGGRRKIFRGFHCFLGQKGPRNRSRPKFGRLGLGLKFGRLGLGLKFGRPGLALKFGRLGLGRGAVRPHGPGRMLQLCAGGGGPRADTLVPRC